MGSISERNSQAIDDILSVQAVGAHTATCGAAVSVLKGGYAGMHSIFL